MKLRFDDMKPDYYEPKAAGAGSNGPNGQPEKQKWGAIYRVPLPTDTDQELPTPQPLAKPTWGAINRPLEWR
jgi:hypothetical protein